MSNTGNKGYTLIHEGWVPEMLVENGSLGDIFRAVGKINMPGPGEMSTDDNYCLTLPDGTVLIDSHITDFLYKVDLRRSKG